MAGLPQAVPLEPQGRRVPHLALLESQLALYLHQPEERFPAIRWDHLEDQDYLPEVFVNCLVARAEHQAR